LTKTGYISYSDSRFNYSYKGFCSIVCGIIDMAMEHYLDKGNFNIEISESQKVILILKYLNLKRYHYLTTFLPKQMMYMMLGLGG